MPTRPSPRSERLGTPNTPAIRFTRGPFFEASLVRHCYGLSGCSPPWTDLTEFPRPPGVFTSRLPAGRSPFPPLGMTTTATGLLCWRDFHPQERQLASLHRTRRARTGEPCHEHGQRDQETGWMARPRRVRPASARTLMNIRMSSWSCDTAPRLSQRPLKFYAQSASCRTALSHGAGRLNLGCIRAHAPIWQAEEAPELELSSPKGALRAARRAHLDRRDCERQPKDPLGKADAVHGSVLPLSDTISG